jgi:hypothetical protein
MQYVLPVVIFGAAVYGIDRGLKAITGNDLRESVYKALFSKG